jgi:hypothetical protein
MQFNHIDPRAVSNHYSNNDSSKHTFPADLKPKNTTPFPHEDEYFSATMAEMSNKKRKINQLSPIQSHVEKSRTQIKGTSLRISDALPNFVKEVTAANPVPNERYHLLKDKSAQANLKIEDHQEKPILVDAG